MSHRQACWVLSSLFSDAKDRSLLEMNCQEAQPGHGFLLLMRILSPFHPGAVLQGQTLLANPVFKEKTLCLFSSLPCVSG